MKFKLMAKVAAALMCGAGLTLAIPMLPAVGQSSPPGNAIRLKSPAVIADRGAVVFATISFTCPAGDEPSLSLTITERSGHFIAQGFGNPPQEVCTGDNQKATVAVTPSNRPFVAGTAFGQASLFDCSFDGCSNSTDQGNIKLAFKKK